MVYKTVEYAPIGTNLGLLYLIWALISGQFLESRGAVFPALARLGLSDATVRRSWAALHRGGWQIGKLIAAWRKQVESAGRWQAVRVDNYRVKAGDMSAVFRPRLQECPSKHYHPLAEKALPAVEVGLCVDVGKVGKQIVPLPALLVQPVLAGDTEQLSSTAQLKGQLIAQISQQQQDDELYVFDPEFTPSELLAVGLKRFVTRLSKNCVARRNFLPEYAGHGRPAEYGEMVRPLARTYKDNLLAATPSDESYSWTESPGRLITVHLWHNLVLSSQKVDKNAPTLTIALLKDPRFKDPWLLCSSIPLSQEAWRTIYRFRWTVERPPLIAKSLLGSVRQFVHSIDVAARLFTLSLLAGCMLAYFAAILPPIPSGFWDRNPKPTAGRLRRLLASLPFPTFAPLPERLRIKASPTAHLPKGVLAHRRSKSSPAQQDTGN